MPDEMDEFIEFHIIALCKLMLGRVPNVVRGRLDRREYRQAIDDLGDMLAVAQIYGPEFIED